MRILREIDILKTATLILWITSASAAVSSARAADFKGRDSVSLEGIEKTSVPANFSFDVENDAIVGEQFNLNVFFRPTAVIPIFIVQFTSTPGAPIDFIDGRISTNDANPITRENNNYHYYVLRDVTPDDVLVFHVQLSVNEGGHQYLSIIGRADYGAKHYFEAFAIDVIDEKAPRDERVICNEDGSECIYRMQAEEDETEGAGIKILCETGSDDACVENEDAE